MKRSRHKKLNVQIQSRGTHIKAFYSDSKLEPNSTEDQIGQLYRNQQRRRKRKTESQILNKVKNDLSNQQQPIQRKLIFPVKQIQSMLQSNYQQSAQQAQSNKNNKKRKKKSRSLKKQLSRFYEEQKIDTHSNQNQIQGNQQIKIKPAIEFYAPSSLQRVHTQPDLRDKREIIPKSCELFPIKSVKKLTQSQIDTFKLPQINCNQSLTELGKYQNKKQRIEYVPKISPLKQNLFTKTEPSTTMTKSKFKAQNELQTTFSRLTYTPKKSARKKKLNIKMSDSCRLNKKKMNKPLKLKIERSMTLPLQTMDHDDFQSTLQRFSLPIYQQYQKMKQYTSTAKHKRKFSLQGKRMNILKTIQRTPSHDSIQTDSPKKIKRNRKKAHPYRHLVFSPKIQAKLFEQHLLLTYKGLVYALRCLKPPSLKFINKKAVELPRENQNEYEKKTLVLDLDETLVHTTSFFKKGCIPISVKAAGDQPAITYYLNLRPYCRDFLQEMSKIYEIIVFTASTKEYAEEAVGSIDPLNKYVDFILCREDCMVTKNGFYLKDLRILKDRKLENVIIIDNLAHSFGFQIENGIPILKWTNLKSDSELFYLQDFLIQANKAKDVRGFLKAKLKLHQLADESVSNLMIKFSSQSFI